MKFKKSVLCIFISLIISASLFCTSVSAESTYKTYTYTSSGNVEYTPDAYSFSRIYTGEDFGCGMLSAPGDMTIGPDGCLYIADTGNNRVVVLNSDYTLKFQLSEFLINGEESSFNQPQGLFVTNSSEIYVADTQNGRIVKFDSLGQFVREFKAPEISVLTVEDQEFIYRPTALTVDASGRMYVVAQSVNMGILQISKDGEYQGFVGTQRVSYNPLDYFWKQILTTAQNSRMVDFVPTEYNNITADEKGFLYLTASAIDADALAADISSPSQSPGIAAVRKINPSGYDVLRRNGGISICGDLKYEKGDGASTITDVALGPAGTYTLLDTKRCRYFTYSRDGEMLFAFSSPGTQLPNASTPTAILYRGSDLLVLDSAANKIIEYSRTEYGELLHKALDCYNGYDFEGSVEVWKEVLLQNSNMELAYIGIAKSYLQQGEYTKAMEYFKLTGSKSGYSQAFSYWRQGIINKRFIPVVLAAAAILVVWFFLLSLVKKHNRKAEAEPLLRKKIISRLTFSHRVIFHPFDGFWCLKNEGRGSVAAATVFLVLAAVGAAVRATLSGYIFSSGSTAGVFGTSLLNTVSAILMTVFLWIISNWCVTSLMDGKGTLRDIYIYTCYSLLPLIICSFLATGLSHILTANEGMYISFVMNIGYIWTLFLIFFGALTTHDYTLSKNTLSSVLSVVGMGVILFISLLILTVFQRMWGFLSLVYNEIAFRI